MNMLISNNTTKISNASGGFGAGIGASAIGEALSLGKNSEATDVGFIKGVETKQVRYGEEARYVKGSGIMISSSETGVFCS